MAMPTSDYTPRPLSGSREQPKRSLSGTATTRSADHSANQKRPSQTAMSGLVDVDGLPGTDAGPRTRGADPAVSRRPDVPRAPARPAAADDMGAEELRQRLRDVGVELADALASSSGEDEGPSAGPSPFLTQGPSAGKGDAPAMREAAGSGSRRGWTLLSEMERRQESLRGELREYVTQVQESLPAERGRGELTAADFSRMVASIMATKLEDIGLASDDDDDRSVDSDDVEAYFNPFLNHPEERVREGYKRVMELDRVLKKKQSEQERVDVETFPQKHEAAAAERARRRRETVLRRLRRERRRRVREAQLQRVLGEGGAGGEADAPDDVSDVTGLTGMSRVTATSAGRNSLRPEEEDLVDRLLALDDEELEAMLMNPFDLEGADAAVTDDAASVASSHRSVLDIDRKLAELARQRGDHVSARQTDAHSVAAKAPSMPPMTPIAEERPDKGAGAGQTPSDRGAGPHAWESNLRAPSGRSRTAAGSVADAAASEGSGRGAGGGSVGGRDQEDWLRAQRVEREERAREKEIDARLRVLQASEPTGGAVGGERMADLLRMAREELGMPPSESAPGTAGRWRDVSYAKMAEDILAEEDGDTVAAVG